MQVFANTALPQEMAAAQSGRMNATDDGTNSSTASSSTSNSATITANDFLQLLVTEMQNQDPTSQTDPNEYINQLVGVNSLEQLVDINQDLSGTASTTSGTGTSGTSAVSGATAATPGPAAASGNLSAPVPGNAAALRVASALGGTTSQAAPLPSSETGAASGNRFDAIVAALRSRAAAKPTTTNPAR